MPGGEAGQSGEGAVRVSGDLNLAVDLRGTALELAEVFPRFRRKCQLVSLCRE